ncbi:MAG: hypothetical protein VYE22_37315 [Myxococcota bacterium]|nr:hypothetical protein [Myxococcota bacterium]
MSENDDKSPGEIELDELEWDDALADWETELDDSAEAKAPPLPQTSEPSRALYRPPSPDDTFAKRSPRAPAPPPPKPVNLDDFPGLDEEDDEEMESTRIASIPQELINSLVGKDAADEERGAQPTKPPPPLPISGRKPAGRAPEREPAPARAAPPPVDLDLDGLLDGLDEETRAYPSDVRAPTPRRPSTPAPERPLAGTDAEAEFFGSAPPPPATPEEAFFGEPALEKDAEEGFDPFGAPGDGQDFDEGAARTRMADLSEVARQSAPPEEPQEANEEAEEEPEPRTRMADLSAIAEEAEADAGERPTKPPAAGADEAGTRPTRPPEAGAAGAAKPAFRAPSIPKPSLLKPRIPKPGLTKPGAKPTIPKPGIPRPGGIPKPKGIPRPGGFPKPGLPPKLPTPGKLGLPRPGQPKKPAIAPPAPPPTPPGDLPSELTAEETEPATPERVTPLPAAGLPAAGLPAAGLPAAEPVPPPLPTAEAPTAERPTPVPEAEPTPAAKDDAAKDDAEEEEIAAAQTPPTPTGPRKPAFESAELDMGLAELDALIESEIPPPPLPSDDAVEAPAVEAPELELGEPPQDEPEDDEPAIAVAETEEEEDDEPAIAVAEADDDEDELVVESGEVDDEEWAELAEAGELDDEEWAEIEAAEAAEQEAAAAAPDRGALAARRSVRSRKPRQESFPMVGDGPEAMRLRMRLLRDLAESKEGPVRARLLVGAAELAEQLGEGEDARDGYRAALEADPSDVVALRALRRDAVLREAWDEVAASFEKEAALPLSAWERALAWTGLAELKLGRLEDPEGAEAAASKALEAQPLSVTATILLAEARWRQGKTREAVQPFAAARDVWDDPDGRAALAVEEARALERAGDEAGAREIFAWANEVDPEALDAWFGRARAGSRADSDPRGTVEALATLAAYCGGSLGEAVLTRASRVATRLANDPQLGVRLLGQATGVVPLQARADAAAATGDRELEREALEAWSGAAGGTDRALALVRMAEVKAAAGDLDGADAALRDAALADGSLGTIRVVREVIARRSGDVSRLVDATQSGGALASAARVARDRGAVARERELLAQASQDGVALVSVDVLTLDAAANDGDDAAIDLGLRRQADRVPPEQRAGSLLALTERAVGREDLEAAYALLEEARQVASGDPLALRPLGRLALQRDATAAAALWMEEASVSDGARSAFCATQAGRILTTAGGDALGAFRRALDAVSGYGPAAWALKPLAVELGDPLTLGEAHEQLAEAAVDPTDAASHLVRGALLRADADPSGAGALLDRARQLAPGDGVLQSLLMRLAGSTSPAERAAMLTESAASAPAELARVYRLQAAAAYEDAGDPAAAAEQLKAVATEHADDPIVRVALDRVEIAAGAVARVAERRFAAVKEAADDEARVFALERLAELDRLERNDPASAVLSLQSILETAPGHLPSLRALFRYFAEHGRLEDLGRVTEALALHVQGGADVTAHLRLARRLAYADAEAPGESADDVLIEAGKRAELDLWLAPRVLAAARERGEAGLARKAAAALASALSSPDERASARVRAAELTSDAETKESILREAVQSSPQHPTAAEALARACVARGDDAAAAEALEAAAKATEVRGRAAALLDEAAKLWDEKVGDAARARAALELASERDVTHGDVFTRLQGILETAGDRERLAQLLGARISAGGEPAELVALYLEQAELRKSISDVTGAKASLRSALGLEPERIEALRDLAELCLEDEDWRGAAEVLIRIARIRKEREELRWVFFTLGDIYDQHMPDPRRAEAAFRRVLKLLPRDVPAMERLAKLYEREGQLENAAQMLAQLAQLDVDPDSNRGHRLQLAAVHERLGDARKAEQVLDEARKNAPTDLGVLKGLADFYDRQGASNALAMHLGRAVNDFRHALEADLGDAAAWPGLVEILQWRGQTDAAACAASAAQAVGVMDVEMSKLVDARGAAQGVGQAAAKSDLDELLAPPALNAPTRAVFKLAGDALEKALPFDVAAYRAQKVDGRDTSIRPLANEVSRWFGFGAYELYVTSAAPRVCVPVHSNPCTLLIGSELIGITDDREKLFVLARAFRIAKAQLSVVVRAQPHEVNALLGGLVQSYDPHHAPAGVDPSHLAEAARRVSKHVNRKVRDELGPLVYEMAGRPGYDPAGLAMAASEWGNRVGLLASGSAPAGISALAKLSGERELPADTPARLALVTRFPEASALLEFAISDAHFEARRRSGIG